MASFTVAIVAFGLMSLALDGEEAEEDVLLVSLARLQERPQ